MMEVSFMDLLRKEIEKGPPPVSSEDVDKLMSKFFDMGVDCMADLQEVEAEDLQGLLPLVRARKLIRRLNETTRVSSNRVIGVAGGTVCHVSTAGAVHGNITLWDDRVQELKEHTQKRLTSFTEGMIKVSAVNKITQKLKSGQEWITITGNPGDGKTTLGYLVLEALKDEEAVYVIQAPEDFHQLTISRQKCTVMLNDIFGAFNADLSKVIKWKHYINDTLDNKVNSIHILFVVRRNVLQSAKACLERYGEISDPNCVVDLSKSEDKDERLQLLNYHLITKGIEVDDRVKDEITKIMSPHGFPHCCKMYAEIQARGEDIDIKAFFQTPLRFLDTTTRHLMTKKECWTLFREMVKNGGILNVLDISDENHSVLLETAMDLYGSYLRKIEHNIEFTHPSMYASVVNVIGQTDEIFIVKNAKLSIILQIVNIKEADVEPLPDCVNINPSPTMLKTLCERFSPEVLHKQFSIFRHRFCENRDFCEMLVQSCVQTNPSTFDTKIHIDVVDYEGLTMLMTAVWESNLTAASVLLEHGANPNIPAEEDGETVLHYLCQHSTDVNIMRLLIDHGAKVNKTDLKERTALHWLCWSDNANLATVQFLIQQGADFNLRNVYGHTALDYYRARGTLDPDVILLLTKW